MTRRDFLRGVGAFGAAAVLSRNAWMFDAVSAQTRPNIMFFLVDDMGWQNTSEPFYAETTELNRRYRTPNMEALADESLKFTQAYACPLCSPTRISIMTGWNAARHRVTNWTLRKDESPDPEHKTLEMPAWNLNGMTMSPGVDRALLVERTLPSQLRDVGYRTIHVGKAHFGAQHTPGENPLNLGFDVNIAGHCAGGPGSYHGEHNYSAAWRDGDRIWDVPDLETYHGTHVNLTEALTREATVAVDDAIDAGQPFYLYMSHYAIHAPWEEDARFVEKYRDAGLGEFDAVFASMIESMDRSLGELCGHLRERGVYDDTIIVFMSDNGAPKQTPPNRPLRGHKISPYEGGYRVPLMVRWPGVTKGDTVTATPVIIEDVYPTILAMAGVAAKPCAEGIMDGVSFVPVLEGKPFDVSDRKFVWHFPHCYGQEPYSAIRQGDWKLIYFHEPQRYELYNIAEDIGEEHDRYGDEPEIASGLTKALHDCLVETKALMPISKATGKPVPLPG